MRIFISYARVDKPYCNRIVEMLDIHNVWYDYRMYAGDNWWRAIVARLHWCEVFIYLLSPESLNSQYCREEFEIALGLKKKILPILIEEKARHMLPPQLREFQYADVTQGLTSQAFKIIFNALYKIEKEGGFVYTPVKMEEISNFPNRITDDNDVNNIVDNMGKIVEAMEKKQFDQAIFLLERIKMGDDYPHIDLEALIAEAKLGLEEEVRRKRIDVEYRTIAELVRRKITRKLGCKALESFKRENPHYDPENLVQFCTPSPTDTLPQNIEILRQTNGQTPQQGMMPTRQPPDTPPIPVSTNNYLPQIDWVTIPAGMTFGIRVNTFKISRYPITNEQFNHFIEDPRGYRNEMWWRFSVYATSWLKKNPKPRPSRYPLPNHPRENVSWYEAVAFCNWVSAHYKRRRIMLPNQVQWRRAASGDDGRLYPWGMYFDTRKANTRSSNHRRTTPVDYYEDGKSPYGVYDMAGNTWEWLSNATGEPPDTYSDLSLLRNRALLGGSWNTSESKSRIDTEFYLEPQQYYVTIGFRIIMLPQ